MSAVANCDGRLPLAAVELTRADIDGDGSAECIAAIESDRGTNVFITTAVGQTHDLGLVSMRDARPSVRVFTPASERPVLALVGAVGADSGQVRIIRWGPVPELLLYAGGKTIRLSDESHEWPTVAIGTKDGPTIRTTLYTWDGAAFRGR